MIAKAVTSKPAISQRRFFPASNSGIQHRFSSGVALSPPPLRRPAEIAAAQPDPARGTHSGRRLLMRVEKRRVFVFEILQFHALDRLADEPLDAHHVLLIFSAHDGEGVAAGLGATRAADAMH